MSRLSGKRLLVVGVALSAGLGAGVAVAVQATASGGTRSPAPATTSSGKVTPTVKVRPHALATNAHCGQTVAASLTLNGDLICNGNGLIVTANSVTINLGGHVIIGSADAVSMGVRLAGTSDTVTNGNVVQFRTGVQLDGKTDTASALRATFNYDGVVAFGAGDKVTTTQALDNQQFGIAVLGAGDSVTSSKAISNSYGIYVGGTADVVTGNSASSNRTVGVYDVGTGTKLATDVGNFNGGDGLYASDYALIDGGANTAKGNGSTSALYGGVPAEQCFEVSCN